MGDERFDEGMRLLQKQKFDEAIDFFKKFVLADPSDERAWRKLAVSYAAQGQLESAQKSAEEALGLNPNDPEILDLLTGIHSLIGHDEEVLQYSERSIEARPDSPRPWVTKILKLFEMKRVEGAKESYREAIEKAPAIRDPEYWNDLAVDLFGDDDPLGAIAFLDFLIDLEPDEISYMFNKLRPLSRLGRFDEVMALAEEIISKDPFLSPAWMAKGSSLLALDRQDDAIKCFEKALLIDPTNAEARVLIERIAKSLEDEMKGKPMKKGLFGLKWEDEEAMKEEERKEKRERTY